MRFIVHQDADYYRKLTIIAYFSPMNYTVSLYKNILYKNNRAEIWEILRIY